ncbi:Rpn family recombination-promoting nuclease/putative transposase [Nocardia cyriacigeorgica]|uniref:Rpn family recombination-promoting nuclease/putative transposase n=1 Tax=Nocardia cyriacigeorgica TaxID=135487 RepID=UPI003D7911A4
MVESRSNSHDAYFRHVMARPDNAASELRAVLPAEISAHIDWSGLELQSGSFVTPSSAPATATCSTAPDPCVGIRAARTTSEGGPHDHSRTNRSAR